MFYTFLGQSKKETDVQCDLKVKSKYRKKWSKSIIPDRGVVPGYARCAMAPDQLTLFQPGGTDYAHLITTGTPGFSDLPTALPDERKW